MFSKYVRQCFPTHNRSSIHDSNDYFLNQNLMHQKPNSEHPNNHCKFLTHLFMITAFLSGQELQYFNAFPFTIYEKTSSQRLRNPPSALQVDGRKCSVYIYIYILTLTWLIRGPSFNLSNNRISWENL